MLDSIHFDKMRKTNRGVKLFNKSFPRRLYRYLKKVLVFKNLLLFINKFIGILWPVSKRSKGLLLSPIPIDRHRYCEICSLELQHVIRLGLYCIVLTFHNYWNFITLKLH